MEAASPSPLLRLDNGRLRLEVSAATHVGRRRPQNEDYIGLRDDGYVAVSREQGYLFAVADGMGGAEKGEVASRLAVEALFATYYATAEDAAADLPPAAALQASFNAANGAVHDEGLSLESGMMGTTLVACTIVGDMAIFGNVGDSRAYLVRGGHLRQITNDHSLVAEQVRDGILSPAEARQSPHRNIITRAVGHQPRVQSDQYQLGPLETGDVLLLSSDGLHGMVADDELIQIAGEPDLRQAAIDYIEAANAHGGLDNITCLLVRVTGRVASDAPTAQTPADTTPAGSAPPTAAAASPSAGGRAG